MHRPFVDLVCVCVASGIPCFIVGIVIVVMIIFKIIKNICISFVIIIQMISRENGFQSVNIEQHNRISSLASREQTM